MDTLERTVADFAAGEPSVAKLHQARTALSQAWDLLGDAGVIRAGRVVDDCRSDLVARTLSAHRQLALLNSPEHAPEELTDPRTTSISRGRPSRSRGRR